MRFQTLRVFYPLVTRTWPFLLMYDRPSSEGLPTYFLGVFVTALGSPYRLPVSLVPLRTFLTSNPSSDSTHTLVQVICPIYGSTVRPESDFFIPFFSHWQNSFFTTQVETRNFHVGVDDALPPLFPSLPSFLFVVLFVKLYRSMRWGVVPSDVHHI